MKTNIGLRGLVAILGTLVTAATGISISANAASAQRDHREPAILVSASNQGLAPNVFSSSSADRLFLKKLRAGGITKDMISDRQATNAAHKIIYWVCDSKAASRLKVENLLHKYGINERRGRASVDTFAGAALEAYRNTDDPTNC